MIGSILFILGVFLYFTKREYAPFYYISWITVFPFFIDKVIPLTDELDVYPLWGMANYFLFFIFLCSIVRKRVAAQRSIFMVLGLLLLYFFFLSLYHSVGFGNYFVYYRNSFASIFLYLYLLSENKITRKDLKTFFFFYIALQLLISTSQLMGGNNYTFNMERGKMVGIDFFNGTFLRNSGFANTIALFGLIYAIEAYSFSRKSRQNLLCYYGVIILLFLVILLSGIRVSLLEYILFISLVLFFYNKNKILLGVGVLVAILYVYGLIQSVNVMGYGTADATTGVERQLFGIMSLLTGTGGDTLDDSTLGLSLFLINNFFIHSPIFGSGEYYHSRGYAGIIAPDTNNSSDVALALYVTEFGLIALFLLLMLFYVMLSNLSKRYGPAVLSKALFIFFFLLLQTVVDGGLFDNVMMSIFYIYMYYIKIVPKPLKSNLYRGRII